MTHPMVRDWLLHVVPLNTGGVDRFVRDVCARRVHDCILHVGSSECVFECVASREFFTFENSSLIDADLMSRWGSPRAIHAHSTLDPVRSVVLQLSNTLSVEFVLTLHDIDFVGADVSEIERGDRHEFVRTAYTRFAPSRFIATEARRVLPDVSSSVVENGVDIKVGDAAQVQVSDVPELPTHFDIAVVGALGEHKGLSFLREVVVLLPAEVRVILVGYADGRLEPGWLVPNRVWMTGVFEPSDLHAVLNSVGTKLVFFPNRQPESYSYTLSDVWAAGYPALAPDAGALSDRVRAHSAGWVYPRDATPQAVAAELLRVLPQATALVAQVRDAVSKLVSIEQMVASIEHALPRVPIQSKSQQQVVAISNSGSNLREEQRSNVSMLEKHLNTTFMRQEIRKLLNDLAFSRQALVRRDEEVGVLSERYVARGQWIEKLQADVSLMTQQIEMLNRKMTEEHDTFSSAQSKYERDIEQLTANTTQLASKVEQINSAVNRTAWPFRPLLRRWLNRKQTK
jgi:glycosyltransferase involved in cell wall biosynthesis